MALPDALFTVCDICVFWLHWSLDAGRGTSSTLTGDHASDSYELQSKLLKGKYIGDYIGDYYRPY